MSDNAFPEIKSESINSDDHNVTGVWSEGGLTKRELFAAMAMLGIRASYVSGYVHPGDISSAAVKQADALIEELNKNE